MTTCAVLLPTFAFLPNIGPMEMVLIAGAGILLFGKRLPEVGRSLGKGIVEFKKGLRGVEEEIEASTREEAAPAADVRTRTESPKFEIPDEQPVGYEQSDRP